MDDNDMSQSFLNGALVTVPNLPTFSANPYFTSATLDATGETMHMVGQLYYADGYSSASKVISGAGAKITWVSSTTTFANAGSSFTIGVQDVSTASNPAQGDGSFDAYTTLTGGGGGITSSSVNVATISSGTKTVNYGDKIAVSFGFTSRAGADSVRVGYSMIPIVSSVPGFPMCSSNTTGVYAQIASSMPNIQIEFDDGTFGYLFGSTFITDDRGTLDFALDTATADEYANIINLPVEYTAVGIIGGITSATSVSADAEIILYSDPFGTPVAERTIIWDGTTGPAAASGSCIQLLFSSPIKLRPKTDYAIAVRPTVNGQNMRIYTFATASSSIPGRFGFGAQCHAVRRLNNAGAFVDYPSGAFTKNRCINVGLLLATLGQDSHFAQSQIGM